MRILYLAANPKSTDGLRLGREVREIEEELRASRPDGALELVTRWAVRPADLQEALLEVRPHILHFSGHGTRAEELVLEDDRDGELPIDHRALVNLVEILKGDIRLIVLNACFSEVLAQRLVEHVDCAIGTRRAIGDEAAIRFAASFYQAIALSQSIETSFKLGINALQLAAIPEAHTPKLLARDGIDPSAIVLLPRPQEQALSNSPTAAAHSASLGGAEPITSGAVASGATASKPIASGTAASGATTSKPTAPGPITSGATASGPTATASESAHGSTRSGPATASGATASESAHGPTRSGPATAALATVEPTAVEPTVAEPSAVATAQPSSSKRPLWAIAIAVVALAALAIGLWALMRERGSPTTAGSTPTAKPTAGPSAMIDQRQAAGSSAAVPRTAASASTPSPDSSSASVAGSSGAPAGVPPRPVSKSAAGNLPPVSAAPGASSPSLARSGPAHCVNKRCTLTGAGGRPVDPSLTRVCIRHGRNKEHVSQCTVTGRSERSVFCQHNYAKWIISGSSWFAC